MDGTGGVEEYPPQNTISRRPVGIGMSRLVPPGSPSYPPSTHPSSSHRASPGQDHVLHDRSVQSITLTGTPEPLGPYTQPYSLENGGDAAIQPGNQLRFVSRHVLSPIISRSNKFNSAPS